MFGHKRLGSSLQVGFYSQWSGNKLPGSSTATYSLMFFGSGIAWSPDEQKLAFWLIPPPADMLSHSRALVVFNRAADSLDMMVEVDGAHINGV